MHACKQKQTQTHPTLHLILKALKIFLTRWCRSLIGRQEEAGDFCETEVRLLYMVCSRTGKGYTDCLSPASPKNFWHANPPSSGSNSISGKHLNHPKDAGGHTHSHVTLFGALLCLQVLHGPSCAHVPQVSKTCFIYAREG